jgi:hypothetical protein
MSTDGQDNQEDEGLSAYERQREINIQRNEEIMRDLGLNDAALGLAKKDNKKDE